VQGLRARRLRPGTLWVPDTWSLRCDEEARRPSALVAASPQNAEEQAFVDPISINLNERA
jgi:hypothetical protein